MKTPDLGDELAGGIVAAIDRQELVAYVVPRKQYERGDYGLHNARKISTAGPGRTTRKRLGT